MCFFLLIFLMSFVLKVGRLLGVWLEIRFLFIMIFLLI